MKWTAKFMKRWHSKKKAFSRMDLDMEKTREMHNLYIENIHGRILSKLLKVKNYVKLLKIKIEL